MSLYWKYRFLTVLLFMNINFTDAAIGVIPNQPPTITPAASPVSVSENVGIQTFLYALTVSDVENDPVCCDVQTTIPASNKFDIWWDSTNTEYRLYLLPSPGLNYNTTPMYTVIIECWDDYGASTSDVVVSVLPNTAPTITNLPAEQYIDAKSITGTKVFTVSATDNDSSSLIYTLTSYPVTPDLFAIDAVSGEIRMLNDLTSAVNSAYLLSVTVSDSISTTTENLRILLSSSEADTLLQCYTCSKRN